MLPDNLGYLFDDALRLAPSKEALFQGDRVLTFAELDARVNRAANALAALGVGPGDRVGLMFSNDVSFLEALFGPMRLGAVPVPLNIRMGDEALQYVLADSEAGVLLAGPRLSERARAVAARVPAVKHRVVQDGAQANEIEYEPWLAASVPTLARRRTAPDEICMQP
jgi:acyl-CoA synthetase (AMP-forming)/AMP-acid ligase II